MNSVLVKIWMSVLIAAVCAYGAYSVMRSRGYFDDPPPPVEEPIQVVELKPGSQPLPELADVKLVERSGANLRWNELQGQPWVANIFYTRCQKECSMLSMRIRELQQTIPDVRFVSITCDPNNDKIEVLRAYADSLQADPLRWFFATGDIRDIQAASRALFGFAAKKLDHSPYLALMDREGKFVDMYNGMSTASVQELAEKLKELAAEGKNNPAASGQDQANEMKDATATTAAPAANQ
jgi:protein SCO1/2